MWVTVLLAVLLGCVNVQAKAVFAHFMVENAKTWDSSQWERDINLARDAHIDGFALNIRSDDKSAWNALSTAFKVADSKGDFKMILSFDYAGGGPWSANVVQQHILQFSAYDSYFSEDGKPLVTTFEGPENAGDWTLIKRKTNCLLLPDWSSLGAKQALDASKGVVDGLFSWSSWPWGDRDMNTYVDASYLEFMDQAGQDWGKELKFMMPASPWFYTNLPGYKKNWMWRGDSLWFDRWQQIIFLNPDYVQIISWNDFGESHHIGPLYVEGDEYKAFEVGEAPFNYAEDMPHDGWRQFLPFVIDLYKNRKATIEQEGISAWYRPTPKQSGCDDGWTTGNTASQLQKEFFPYDIVEDKIFYTALLAAHQTVKVTVGGVDLGAKWTHEPEYGSGLYHGSVAYGANLGAVVIQVGSMTLTGRELKASCDQVAGQNGKQNWNAWVGSATGARVSKTVDISKWVCIEGTAPHAPDFAELCEFSCGLGYCPPGACYCSNMGAEKERPDPDTPGYGSVGYPAEGAIISFQGLCRFACDLGYCPPEHCDTKEHPAIIPNVSPFTPDACTSGKGGDGLVGLCSFACNFGFCPVHTCTCQTMGALHEPPAQSERGGAAAEGRDPLVFDAICDFSCSRDYCPKDACVQDGGSGHEVDNPVYIGTQIFDDPLAHCEPPCVLVLPPSELPATTTITIPVFTTSLEVGTTTTTITISPPPLVTGRIPFSNVPVTSPTDGAVFQACTSLALDAVDVTLTYASAGKTTITTRELTLPPWPQVTQGAPDQWTATCDVWGGSGSGSGGDDDDDVPKPKFSPKPSYTKTTDPPVPTWTKFPPGTVEDDNEDDDDDDDDEGVVVVGCSDFWFFNFCPDFEEFKVTKWKFTLPSGRIGPGPPPPSIIQRDGWKIKVQGELPPWPVVTLPPGPHPALEHPSKPEDCETVSQQVEFETVSQGLSVSKGVTVTTTEETITRTATVLGCKVPEYTETISECRVAKRTLAPPAAVAAEPTAQATSQPEAESESEPESEPEPKALVARAPGLGNQDDPAQWEGDMKCPGLESDYIIYPRWHESASSDQVRARLQKAKAAGAAKFDFFEAKTDAFGGAFTGFYVVIQMPASMHAKIAAMTEVGYVYDYRTWLDYSEELGTIGRRDDDGALVKRADAMSSWATSQLCAPRGIDWFNNKQYVQKVNDRYVYNYMYDDSAGEGQVIYVIDDDFPAHTELDGVKRGSTLEVPSYNIDSPPNDFHGTQVAAQAVGRLMGVARKATLVPVKVGNLKGYSQPSEKVLHALLLVASDIKKNGYQNKAVINMSWGKLVKDSKTINRYEYLFNHILSNLESKLGAVLVAASGNDGQHPTERAETYYPQALAKTGKMPNMLVVGAVDINARRWAGSNFFTNNEPPLIYAWGKDVDVPMAGDEYGTNSGTSFAAPQVAGLVAYLRGLPSKHAESLKSPAKVAKMVRDLTRPLEIAFPGVTSDDLAPDALVWNAQIEADSCLVTNAKGCPSWLSSGGGSSGSGGAQYTFSQGEPSPTCTADCGLLCTGYYCGGTKPTDPPPDFGDPINSKPVATKTEAKPEPTKAANNAIDIAFRTGGGRPVMSLWYVMNGIVDGNKQDLCNSKQLVVVSSSADEYPGFPTFDTDFHGEDVFGNSGCKYTPSSTGGSISCDGGVSVKCADPKEDSYTCAEGSRYEGATMRPSVRCSFK